MFHTRINCKALFLVIIFLQTGCLLHAQNTSYPIDEWVTKLRVKKDIDNNNFRGIESELGKKDSAVVNHALRELEQKGGSAGHYFKSRFLVLKAVGQYRMTYPGNKLLVKQLLEQALKEAHATGDMNFISFVSWNFGSYMAIYQEIELAATYCLNAAELNEDLLRGPEGYRTAGFLGEVLFHIKEYKKSIYYTQKALDNCPGASVDEENSVMRLANTLGQAYEKTGQLDTALLSYEKSLHIAEKLRNEVWRGINSGFMGQVFFLQKNYEKARSLLRYDYEINKDHDRTIAGYSLQWLARINLIQGRKDSALLQVKEALHLLQGSNEFPLQNRTYLEKVYYTTADVYRVLGNADSTHHYFQLYALLHDSLQRVAIRSSIDIARLRIDNEKNYLAIQVLEREKKTEKVTRNFVISAIIMFSVIAILLLNRQRQKSKYQKQLALQEKAAAESEVDAAKEQLKMFTQNLVEKTGLIEALEQQLNTKDLNVEKLQILDNLKHQAILTENDWEKFKMLFEKIYPGFFTKLKERVIDITVAEQRMAALTRLHLTTREMAALLGISPNSVNKTKQRLRLRFNLDTETNIEDFITKV